MEAVAVEEDGGESSCEGVVTARRLERRAADWIRQYIHTVEGAVVILYTTNGSVGKAIKAFFIVTWIVSYSAGRCFFRG